MINGAMPGRGEMVRMMILTDGWVVAAKYVAEATCPNGQYRVKRRTRKSVVQMRLLLTRHFTLSHDHKAV